MLTTIHLAIVIVTVALVLYTDEQALSWVLGKQEFLNNKRVRFLHRAIAVGIFCLLVTGGLLYSRATTFYLMNTAFRIKLIAITALILNTYAIERFIPVAIAKSFASLSSRERLPLCVSGAVSFLGWLTAVVCGLTLS